jgi:hypothetical protein
LPVNEQSLIREFIQALAEEIEAIKQGKGGSIITVYDGAFIRREGPFFVYIFSTESPLIVMDDAPAEVEVGGERFSGQIVSVQGSEVAAGIEHDFGPSIPEARLITNLWYLLEALRKRYEEDLAGQRSLETRLGQRLFGFAAVSSGPEAGDLGKLVRYGNISPNSSLPDMVVPDKIAEKLGQHLKEQLAKHQAELGRIQSSLSSLRQIETLLASKAEAHRQLGELETNMRRCSEANEEAKSRKAALQAELEQARARLAEAQAAGRLKRLFRGLDPAKIQVQVARTEGELGTAHRTITAGAAKLTEFQVTIKKAQGEEERCANEAYALLSRHRLDAANVPGRIAQLSKQADELTAAIRAIEAELEALLAKTLREAKVIATSLTKATISKQMDDQKFDVVVVDEVSMAFSSAAWITRSAETIIRFGAATESSWMSFVPVKTA